MDGLFKDLNDAQKEAVVSTKGPVMAIAGAGSGKTRVLTRRVAHLIFNERTPPGAVLAITFTNKAADEMKSRISSLLSMPTGGMWISTFHSMCVRILRRHIERLGYRGDFQIIDDDDVTQLIRIILKKLDVDVKMVRPKSIKYHILKMKTDPSCSDDVAEPLKRTIEAVFPLYQAHLKKNNLLDFEDLLVLTVALLRSEEDVRAAYQTRFKHILVDEFQDTNDIQYDLVRLLAGKRRNVFIVGDEDQSIYAFRGANIGNIRRFARDFDPVKAIRLEQNYRSTNQILRAANDVIRHNKERFEKTLFSTRPDGEPVRFFKAYTYLDEADYVAETIRRLRYTSTIGYDDIAVLYRANNTSRVFERALKLRSIPYNIVGTVAFFGRKEIKDVTAYLRLIVNRHDDTSFGRVVNEPRRGIGAKTMETLALYAERSGLSFYDAVHDAGNPLSKSAIRKLKTFTAILARLSKRLEEGAFCDIIDAVLEETGFAKALMEDVEMGEIRFENVLELKTLLKENSPNNNDTDRFEHLAVLLQDIALRSRDDEFTDGDAVTLMTLHAAKGLEFSTVFIVALEQGVFPLERAIASPVELSEERRLMYVGMTRAKDRLFLTNAKERVRFGEPMRFPDSMFLKEIGHDRLEREGLNRPAFDEKKPQKTEKALRPRTHPLATGDKIRHKVFGEGVVVSVEDDRCRIAFAKPHGIKTLLKDHPAIETGKETGDGRQTTH